MSVARALKKFGSKYHVAIICGIAPSTISRYWGDYVPAEYVKILKDTPAATLKHGGKR